MGKYRSAAFKGLLDKEVAAIIADFIGVTEQEAIVIVSLSVWKIPHTYFGDE